MVNNIENDLITLVRSTKKAVEQLDENNPDYERLVRLIKGLEHIQKYTGYLSFWRDLEAESDKINTPSETSNKANFSNAKEGTLGILNEFLEIHYN
jgi:hypothetical protein